MDKNSRPTSPRETKAKDDESKVGEPQATYLVKATRRARPSLRRKQGYDARRYTGMIPGIAERMKEYV